MSVSDPAGEGHSTTTKVDSYRRLTEVYHRLLSEESLGPLLESIADALEELVPHDTLSIYQAEPGGEELTPVLARDQWAEEIMSSRISFGQGITGWVAKNREAVLVNEAHLDSRVSFVPGTPIEPEALICVPLISRGEVKGTLNVYRQGDNFFDEDELEVTSAFADAAALALDNAQIREALEHQAQTDPLTGLYNHRFFHERLRSELMRASRTHDTVGLILFDIDDFKRLNDVHGHAIGDHVLVGLAEILRTTVRASDVACRVGGEEFGVILPSCGAGDAIGLARRLRDRLGASEFDEAGTVTVSLGISQGPEHAMNPRELVGCAEAAMMNAKVRGKNQWVLYDDGAVKERSGVAGLDRRDVRSIAHLKMLQSLAGKLNRLNDVRQIANTIANELRTLIDYHNCRVYLAEGSDLLPIAFRGHLSKVDDDAPALVPFRFGEGITGRAAATGKSLLIPSALECEFAVRLSGTNEIEESLVAVPMLYGSRVNGVVTISKLGRAQFDNDDVRLLEVLAGQASVALENARLYEAQRRQAENAQAILTFADKLAVAPSPHAIGNLAVSETTGLLQVQLSSLWLQDERTGLIACAAHQGYIEDPSTRDLVRHSLTPEMGSRLLGGRTHPFLLHPEEVRTKFDARIDLPLTVSAVAPLQSNLGINGWLVAREPAALPNHFTPERMELLAGLAYQVSVAMQRARLYQDQKESAEIASTMLDFSRGLAKAEDLEEIMEKIVERTAYATGSPKTKLWLQDPKTKEMECCAVWGFDQTRRAELLGVKVPISPDDPVLTAFEPFVMTPDSYADMEGAEVGEGLTWAIAPIHLEGGRLGYITAAAPALGSYQFSERKMRLLEGIADQAKLAVNNATNFETLEVTFMSTVEALANALEAKDEYTSSHTRSIVDMSTEVGAAMGITGKALKRLEMGALFHDIGKIGIPSDILLKPGPLTDEEREVMKTHPELGAKILEPIDRLADVRPIVRACHEHFDGSGYPEGKVGEEIPIESRIILVCDAFDAMTTDRPYRKALPQEEAFRRLRESARRQFDPQVVETFLNLPA